MKSIWFSVFFFAICSSVFGQMSVDEAYKRMAERQAASPTETTTRKVIPKPLMHKWVLKEGAPENVVKWFELQPLWKEKDINTIKKTQ